MQSKPGYFNVLSIGVCLDLMFYCIEIKMHGIDEKQWIYPIHLKFKKRIIRPLQARSLQSALQVPSLAATPRRAPTWTALRPLQILATVSMILSLPTWALM